MMFLPDEKVVSLYKAGWSIDKIWDTYYIPVEMIRKILVENDIHIRENDGHPSKV